MCLLNYKQPICVVVVTNEEVNCIEKLCTNLTIHYYSENRQLREREKINMKRRCDNYHINIINSDNEFTIWPFLGGSIVFHERAFLTQKQNKIWLLTFWHEKILIFSSNYTKFLANNCRIILCIFCILQVNQYFFS